jgi:hypothetical protein
MMGARKGPRMTPPDRNPDEPNRFLLAVLGFAVFLLAAGLLSLELQGPLPTSATHLFRPAEILVWIAMALLTLGVLLWLAFPSRGSRRPPAGHEAWICPNCFTAYVPDAHFCPHCAAPVDEFAGRGGYEQIYASAWILGKAARSPTRRLHVWGLLLVALPANVGLAALPGLSGMGVPGVAVALFGLVNLAIYVALVVLAIQNWRRGRSAPAYGAPPWWTHDVEWELGEEATPEESSESPA